jgi:LPXTG-motif cell wall-anchored protein
MAGNVAEPATFNPLDVQADPVTDITTSGASLNAYIIEGTCELETYYIQVKKASQSDKRYTRVTSVVPEETESGYKLTCDFVKLSAGTEYNYRIYAKTKTSNEVKTLEGSFTTLDEENQGYISGTVEYDGSVNQEFRTYPIYVTLTSGDCSYGGITIGEESDGSYAFEHVPDGEYQVNVSCGIYSDTATVIITDGSISYPTPEDYLAEGGINFLINGLSTSLDIAKSVKINADGLDSLFETTYYANVWKKDYDALAGGGNILITLHADKIEDETSIDNDVLDTIGEDIGEENNVVKYFDIYMTKTITNGTTGETTVSDVTERLPDGTGTVNITFTDKSLAGKPMYVVGVSIDSLTGNTVSDTWGPSYTGTLTVNTQHCSVYAIYTTKPKTYTVTWLDGDRKEFAKTEVVEGNAAVPPEGTPTMTSDSDKYEYVFAGWPEDEYSSITENTTIQAKFTKKTISSGLTPEDPDDDKDPGNTGDTSSTTENSGGSTGGTSTTEKPGNTGDTSTTEKPGGSTGDASTTEKPGNTGDTSTTEKPGNTGDTSTTEKPGTTGSTATTEKPGSTATTEKPSTTEKKPSTTEKPGSTATTEKPGSTLTTEKPSTTEKPGSTATTEKPSSSSATTVSPAATTEAPAQTTTTQEPDDSGTVIVVTPDAPSITVVTPSGAGTSGSSDTSNTAGVDVEANSNHYSYLGTTSSPKTGDETPIVVVGILLMISAAGFVIVVRKNKRQN